MDIKVEKLKTEISISKELMQILSRKQKKPGLVAYGQESSDLFLYCSLTIGVLK
jgi:hypothetical protein